MKGMFLVLSYLETYSTNPSNAWATNMRTIASWDSFATSQALRSPLVSAIFSAIIVFLNKEIHRSVAPAFIRNLRIAILGFLSGWGVFFVGWAINLHDGKA